MHNDEPHIFYLPKMYVSSGIHTIDFCRTQHKKMQAYEVLARTLKSIIEKSYNMIDFLLY